MRAKKATSFQQYSHTSQIARQMWPELSEGQIHQLQVLVRRCKFSVSAGDLLLLQGRWYVTHSGLLRLAHRSRCRGIRVQPVREFCDTASARWAFEATVYKSATCKGFV